MQYICIVTKVFTLERPEGILDFFISPLSKDLVMVDVDNVNYIVRHAFVFRNGNIQLNAAWTNEQEITELMDNYYGVGNYEFVPQHMEIPLDQMPSEIREQFD